MSKLIFLDMDGVLNSMQSSHYYWKLKGRKSFMNDFDTLCPIACSNLQHILENVSKVQVVISSTWRLFHSIEDWDQMKDKVPDLDVIGMTPNLAFNPRGHEIHKWLRDNNRLDSRYAVIDDDSDMDKVEDNFFKIDYRVGLSWVECEKIIEHLNKDEK